jgi:hypothetical protein
MDAILSPVPMTVIVVLYAYAQLRSLIGWEGGWRTLSLTVLFGELLWLAFTVGSKTDFFLASIVLGCMTGLAVFAVAFLVRLALKSVH